MDEEDGVAGLRRARAPSEDGRFAARDGVGTHGDAGSGGGVRADGFGASAMPTGWGAPAMTPTSMAKNPRGSEAKR